MRPVRSRAGLWLALSLALVAVGCHSAPAPQAENAAPHSAPAPVAAPQPPTPQTQDDRPVIVAFGDSLTAGHGAPVGASYPDYLQKDLDAAGYRYHVVNAGISGNTTKDGVDRLPSVLALHPALVIVEFGGNDGLRGLPISATRANLDRIVSTLRKARIPVALAGITLPPNYGSDYIRQFNDTYTLLAARYHAPLLPFLLKNAYGVPGDMQEDGIHATAQGNQQVARNVLQLIQPLLSHEPRHR